MNRLCRWLGLFLGCLLLIACQGRPTAPESVIYLEPAGAIHSIADQTLKGLPVTKVQTAAELQKAWTPATTAIWIHREALGQVDKEWLRSQYFAGQVIVGIDLDLYELSAALDQPVDDAGWIRHQDLTRPLYALMARASGTATNSEGGASFSRSESQSSDFLQSPRQLLSIQRQIHEARAR